ncbi:Yip1-domain-containing protein [Dacryopinax primogenitus]|uniref:Protein YIP n=1 Tax=Dacryopinax primogenitus (strain DJM 731) TaxID=1858805 RepID=M5FUI6_DACPD|nr:Yip1-domain-containing protein [Dacryopinax primogenitus]EJU01411.1 Yip1-domain-containing protein [Dacryopinax primogenitus]
MSGKYQTLDVNEEAQPLEFKSFLGQPDAAVEPAPAATSSRRGYTTDRPVSTSFWQVEHYQKWFDVDTNTVLMRCLMSMYPIDSHLTGPEGPDLYGPFWTLTTLILALFVSSSLASSIASYLSSEPTDYNWTLLSVAVGLIYIYGLAVPTGIWAVLQWSGVQECSVVECLSIWGYGMTVWIPTALLCIIPVPLLRWGLTLLAALISLAFIIRNIYPILATAESKSVRLFVIVFIVLHLGVALSLKIVFFSYYVAKPIG